MQYDAWDYFISHKKKVLRANRTRLVSRQKLDKLMGYENVAEEQPLGIEDALKTLFSTDPETT